MICHATCVLLKTKLSDGTLLVKDKTWTGFANSEEDYADAFVGKKIQPFRIEDQARKLQDTNFIVGGRFCGRLDGGWRSIVGGLSPDRHGQRGAPRGVARAGFALLPRVE